MNNNEPFCNIVEIFNQNALAECENFVNEMSKIPLNFSMINYTICAKSILPSDERYQLKSMCDFQAKYQKAKVMLRTKKNEALKSDLGTPKFIKSCFQLLAKRNVFC